MMDNPTLRPGARESLIDQDCFFEGTFRTPGNMRIEGTYQGAIECRGTLLVAESGNVNARVLAGNLTVSGLLQGEVQCDGRLEILRSGRVSGNIAAKTVVVHDGAFFEGEMRMGDPRAEIVTAAPYRATPLTAPTATPARRRPTAEEPIIGTEREPDVLAEETESIPVPAPSTPPAPAPPPRTNGRGSGVRDTLPNRTGEG